MLIRLLLLASFLALIMIQPGNKWGTVGGLSSPQRINDATCSLLHSGEYNLFISSMSWSPDSQTFFFHDAVYDEDNEYQVNTRQLVKRDTAGSVITLTMEEQELFKAAGATAFVSPDNRYFVYLSELEV